MTTITPSVCRQDEIKSRSYSDFDSRYERLHRIGKGNFGKVYVARDRKHQKQVAIKIVDKRKFTNKDQAQHAYNEKSISEMLTTCYKHKNIVNVYDVCTDGDRICIVMEHVRGGELFDKIREHGRLSEATARRWFREIIEAIHYIHKHGIVHRDLKPENVLIDVTTGSIRLCDFGFAKFFQQHDILDTYCGSPFYASPEMVSSTPYKGPPADMWSCGVILYAMLTGQLPFHSENMPCLFEKIRSGRYAEPRVSSEASNLIHHLLCKNPAKRITAEACLKHPWLQHKGKENPVSGKHTRSSQRKPNEVHPVSTPILPNHNIMSPTKSSHSFWHIFHAKKAQIYPTLATEKPPSKRSNAQFSDRFKRFIKNAFHKRIGTNNPSPQLYS
ncbi:kinase-like domain-containing protein [Radiomyces spectabilis]|uniref:kinase-like domain-containing protein n=1 Tax=Radiomyces spectabilis TaxID=64574 RepID=UPI0022203FE0|nr:kinase-like domain-containing protein [Radiomyces spectabilis]KAI8374220.1 kinase-like domain-containing protein [Radiomyces spectabilis]